MLEIFQFEFMQRAFIAGTLIAILSPAIGSFLVIRRYSLMADTLAHVSLAGIAISSFLGTPPIITALITSVIASIGIDRLRSTKKYFGESLLALFLSGSLALAIVLIGLSNGSSTFVVNYLFGSITTVTTLDIITIFCFSILVICLLILFFNKLFFIAFDEELAQANGINVQVLNILLVTLGAITVSLSMRIVGVLLIGALMVIPFLTAVQFKKGFKTSLFLSILFSLFSVLTGLFASYYLGVASGGTIVLITLILFIISIVWNKKS